LSTKLDLSNNYFEGMFSLDLIAWLNLYAFLLPLIGAFQLEVQNNLSKAYKETKGPKQLRKTENSNR
jgi:sigma54-dependent transcription regulator